MGVIEFKDGDDNNTFEYPEIFIKKVDNGWIITASYHDGEITEVYDDCGLDDGNYQVIKSVLESMGLSHYLNVLTKKK